MITCPDPEFALTSALQTSAQTPGSAQNIEN